MVGGVAIVDGDQKPAGYCSRYSGHPIAHIQVDFNYLALAKINTKLVDIFPQPFCRGCSPNQSQAGGINTDKLFFEDVSTESRAVHRQRVNKLIRETDAGQWSALEFFKLIPSSPLIESSQHSSLPVSHGRACFDKQIRKFFED